MCQEKGLLIDSHHKKAQAWLGAKTQLMPSGFRLPASLMMAPSVWLSSF